MKIFELITHLNNKYSFNLAEDYDNVGLLIGDENLEVKKVFTSLDIDLEICVEAVENGCNVIVSHHPLFAFDPLKRIDYNVYSGKLVKYIICEDILLFFINFYMSVCVIYLYNYRDFSII